MDVTIFTSDPDYVDVPEIRRALERLDYFVGDIVLVERGS